MFRDSTVNRFIVESINDRHQVIVESSRYLYRYFENTWHILFFYIVLLYMYTVIFYNVYFFVLINYDCLNCKYRLIKLDKILFADNNVQLH